MYAKSSNCIIRVFVIQVIIVQRFSCKLNKLELDQKQKKNNSKLYLLFPVKDATAVVQLINEDLAKIATWCCYNGLLINPDKTNLLVMGNSQMLLSLHKDFHVILLGKEVTSSNSVRDLGIEMDPTI